MSTISIKMSLAMIFSVILGFCLTILPLPVWAVWYRPEWLLLVIIYWCLTFPDRFNVGYAWTLGLLLDTLHGTLLGEHALAFALVAYITAKSHRRIRFFSLWQQALTVFGLVVIFQIIIFIIQGLIGQASQTWMFWLPSFTSMLLWPWIFLLLGGWLRRFRMA